MLPPPSPPGWQAAEVNTFCLARGGTSVTRGGAGGLVASRKGEGVQRDQNSWARPFKDKCVSAFYLLEETLLQGEEQR